jgi:hypothetical protein
MDMVGGTIAYTSKRSYALAAKVWGVSLTSLAAEGLVILPTYWGLGKSRRYKNGVYAYQVVDAVVLYMKMCSDCNGAIYGNVMGQGKTLIACLIMMLGVLHVQLCREIREDTSPPEKLEAQCER